MGLVFFSWVIATMAGIKMLFYFESGDQYGVYVSVIGIIAYLTFLVLVRTKWLKFRLVGVLIFGAELSLKAACSHSLNLDVLWLLIMGTHLWSGFPMMWDWYCGRPFHIKRSSSLAGTSS